MVDLAAASTDHRVDACSDADHAVFLAEATRLDDLRVSRRAIEHHLSRALDRLATDSDTPSFLHGGLTGVGVDIECVRALGKTSISGANEIDRMLLHAMSAPLAGDCHFDLISGLVGFAVYMLARLPRKTAGRCLEQLVDRFTERAEPVPGGLAWRTPPKQLSPADAARMMPGELFDLGVAHGVAGVVAVLAQLQAHRIRPAQTRKLLRQATNWLIDQQLEGPGLRFPTHAADRPPTPTRSAWCYGDAGVCVALFSAARALGDRAIAEQALTIARRSAALSPEQAGIQDACVCHGTAGLAHIYNRLYQATGDDELRDAAVAWFRRTLDSRTSKRGAGGFLFYGAPPRSRRRPGRWPDRSLLTGSMGVGLALVSACADAAPRWDRVLLLDIAR
jgi:lantibiotic modifying enzyme